jgi:hypothetical protein
MADNTIITGEVVERDPAGLSASASRTPFSWSAAIAGALAATAVTFIILALGSGIGLSVASPYSGPSATSLTIAAALWLVLAQTIGFATGGYLAGRLRSPAHDGVLGETTFRDAAQGLVAWAIGVVAGATVIALIGYFAAGASARLAAEPAAGAPAAREAPVSTATSAATTDYYVDLMFRPAPGSASGPASTPSHISTVGVGAAGAHPVLSPEARAEVKRIMVRSVAAGGLEENDHAYLAQVVAARTGLSPDEAQRRVSEVETKARESAKEAVDKAATAGAFFSFWLFMSLLFGGTAATLSGIVGGQLRDAQMWRLAEAD